MKIFVIIPGYNEEQYLDDVLRQVLAITPNVIYVDDGSKDQSPQIAKRHAVHILRHETNLGKGAALRTGCDYAFHMLGADAVVFLDADGQHNPRELRKFFSELQAGAELVFGVRKFSSTMPLMRLIGNRFASIALNILFGYYIPDIPSGYKAITSKRYELLHWLSNGYEVEAEIATKAAKHKLPFRIIEIDTIYHDTDKGMTALDGLHISQCMLKWRLTL